MVAITCFVKLNCLIINNNITPNLPGKEIESPEGRSGIIKCSQKKGIVFTVF